MKTKNRIKHSLLTLLTLMAIATPLASFAEVNDKQEELKKEKEAEAQKQREIQDAIKQELNINFTDIYDKLVIVELGGTPSGSGFIAQMDGQTYLFTSKGVMFGADGITFKTASGKSLKPRSVELSTSSNIARLALPDVTGFEISNTLTKDLPIGIFGNSDRGGVATEIYGKISNIGSDFIETSAPFVNGNSGSPVLNTNQQVIAMASHVRYTSSKDENGNKKVKRICHRMNKNQWQAVNWKLYNKKYGQIYREHKQVLTPIINIIQQWKDDPYDSIYATDVKDVEIKDFLQIQQELIDKLNVNRRFTRVTRQHLNSMNYDIQRHIQNSAAQLTIVCEKYAKRMKFLQSYRDPTGFLQSEFKDYMDYFTMSAKSVQFKAQECQKNAYYSFKEKSKPQPD